MLALKPASQHINNVLNQVLYRLIIKTSCCITGIWHHKSVWSQFSVPDKGQHRSLLALTCSPRLLHSTLTQCWLLFRGVGGSSKDRTMLSASSAATFLKNLEGSWTHGLGPPSNNISLEEPKVTKATDGGSIACNESINELKINNLFMQFGCALQNKLLYEWNSCIGYLD